MNCPLEAGGNAEFLLDYAAGKLKADERVQMERHVATCPGCREFAGAQQNVWQALEDWEPAEESMDFDRRLYARIEQDVSWWTKWMRPLNPIFRRSVPIAAAAGVIVMAGLMLYRPAAAPPPAPAQSAQVETLQADQLQGAIDDMELLHQFNQLVPDNAGPKM